MNSLRGTADVGQVFFLALIGTQLVLVLLAAPAATAGAIRLNRARGTLAHLLVTDLSDSEIVLGKLARSLTPVLLLVASAFPIMTLLTFLGGVDPDALIGAVVVTLGVAVLGSSLALTLSLWSGKTHEAVLVTYGVWALWLGGPVMVRYFGGRLGLLPWVPPGTADPFVLAFAPYLKPGLVGWADYLTFFGATCGLAAALAGLTVVRLRAVSTRDRKRWGSWGLTSRLPRRPRLTGLLPGPSLDAKPVLWREWHRSRPSRWARVVGMLFAVVSVAVTAAVVGRRTGFEAHLATALQVSGGLLLPSVTSATALAEERVRGSLDILMSTPIPTRRIVRGKWLGTFRTVPMQAALPAVVVASRSGWGWTVAVLMAVYVLAVGAAVTSLGLALACEAPVAGRGITQGSDSPVPPSWDPGVCCHRAAGRWESRRPCRDPNEPGR